MIWDILLGVLGAILMLVVFTMLITALTRWFQGLLDRRFGNRLRRPELIPHFARFAAVMTIILLLALFLGLRIGSWG